MAKKSGDSESFDQNWLTREETNYLHWTRAKPINQIQLAFRQHWLLFKEILGPDFKGNRVLEVGCGRGSMSAYFADDNYECTLIDLSSKVIRTAKKIFKHHRLDAKFDVGDALNLPYEDGSFDIVVSIGLLEHFEKIEHVISEQVRVLDRGGLFLGYVVPEHTENVQNNYKWINDILKATVSRERKSSAEDKIDVYRSKVLSELYLEVMKGLALTNVNSSGVYPLPMISHSVSFPFTLLNDNAEKVLVGHFSKILEERAIKTGENPWLCDERYGQAFLLWGFKT